MSGNIARMTIVLVGLMVLGLAWGISPLLTKPTSAEVAINRSDSPVFIASAFKIVNQGGPVQTIISLWDGESPFLTMGDKQRLPERRCTTYKNNVQQSVIRGTQDRRGWPTDLDSMPTPGIGHEQSHTPCESMSSSRRKGGALSVFITRTDTPVALSKSIHHSSWPVTFLFSGNKEADEHLFWTY